MGLFDLKNTSCDVGLHVGNFRVYSVKIENLKKIGCLPENAGCIPSAVVIMTTADEMHPSFSGRHPNLSFLISDLYRLLTEIAEVQYTPVTLNCFSIQLSSNGLRLTHRSPIKKKLEETKYNRKRLDMIREHQELSGKCRMPSVNGRKNRQKDSR